MKSSVGLPAGITAQDLAVLSWGGGLSEHFAGRRGAAGHRDHALHRHERTLARTHMVVAAALSDDDAERGWSSRRGAAEGEALRGTTSPS